MKKILICFLIILSVNAYASIPIDIHWQTADGCHFRLKGDFTFTPGDPTGI